MSKEIVVIVDIMNKNGLLPSEFAVLAEKYLNLVRENKRLAATQKEWLINNRILELEQENEELRKRLSQSFEYSDEIKRRMKSGNYVITIREMCGGWLMECKNLDTGNVYIETPGYD